MFFVIACGSPSHLNRNDAGFHAQRDHCSLNLWRARRRGCHELRPSRLIRFTGSESQAGLRYGQRFDVVPIVLERDVD